MWPFPRKKVAHVHTRLEDMAERVERLEIAARRLKLSDDELAADLEQLSERLNGQLGRILGGGPGRPRKPAGGAQVDIEDIPHGDKAALRRFFAANPPADPKPAGVTSE